VQFKEADDVRPSIEALEGLLRRFDLNPNQRERIVQELKNIQAGAKAERQAAREIELHFGRSPHWATLHDLRFEIGGYPAQIDHLLINRLAEIWVCESKHFNEGAVINEHGEWRRSWQGTLGGMPSPLEQAHRQALLLSRVFEEGVIPAPRRLGVVRWKPHIRSLVLVSDNAWIERPQIKASWLNEVIKSEHLRTSLYDAYDQMSSIRMVGLIGTGALATLGRQLANLHKPLVRDWAAQFGLRGGNEPAS
jgi:hypothetical protein